MNVVYYTDRVMLLWSVTGYRHIPEAGQMKGENTMETKKNVIMNETELEQVNGGDVEAVYFFIERGNARKAQMIFENEKNTMTEKEKNKIRADFRTKFGYDIDNPYAH